MVAARAAVSPTMSPSQQKLMQYLPVVVRRVPGVLPHRLDHLLHGPGDPAHRPAGLHHAASSTATRSPSDARPSGPVTRLESWPSRTARRRWWRRSVRSGQARAGGQEGRRPGQGVTKASKATNDAKAVKPAAAATRRRRRSGRPRRRAARPRRRSPRRHGRPRARRRVDPVAVGPRATTNVGADQRRNSPDRPHAWPVDERSG